MRNDILIGNILKIFSVLKIVYYKLFYGIEFPFGSIISGWPKIRFGNQITIDTNFGIGRFCRLQGNIKIGKNFFMNEFGTISSGGNGNSSIIIGNNVMIGPFFFMISGDHGFSKGEVFNTSNSGNHSNIIIGDNVWIGARVTILKGVSIGNNVVIGAGSVVTKSISDNVLAVGNPCTIKKVI